MNPACSEKRHSANWLRRLFMPSSCDWMATGWNPFGMWIEERCSRCGNYRHHLAEDLRGEDILWRAGKHPNREGNDGCS